MSLEIRLLGPLQILHDMTPITGLRSRKALALFVYLAQSNQPVARAKVVDLIWPEQDEKRGRANLSWALNHLKKHLPGVISAERHTLQFTPTPDFKIDTHQLQLALASSDQALLEASVNQLQGEFLAGFTLDGSPDFELWVIGERERMRQQAVAAATTLIQRSEQAGRLADALPFAEKWVALMPWREAAHQQLMRCYAAAGQREAAIAQFERCQRILQDELAVEPSAETVALLNTIRSASDQPANAPKHNISQPQVPLFGRDAELTQLTQLISNGTRLVTLVGVGGVGKTRLATELAWQQKSGNRFPDGVYLLEALSITQPAELLVAIAQLVGAPSGEGKSLTATLHNFLRQKRLLLVIDNFEQLLEAASEVAGLLVESAGLSIVVTSQAKLNVSAETILPLNGLEPSDESALALFNHFAQQQDARYRPTDAEVASTKTICRRLDGNPLAIQLAATWVPLLSPDALLDQINHDLSFLSSELSDLPDRHRSLKAVYAHAVRHLNRPEQTLLLRLAIFETDFSFDSAVAVADAHPSSLLRLVNRSLVAHHADGRYALHPVIRSLAFAELSSAPIVAKTQGQLASYVEERFKATRSLFGSTETTTIARMRASWPTLRSGWFLMLKLQRWSGLAQSLQSVDHFLSFTSQVQLGEMLFSTTTDSVRNNNGPATLLAGLLTRVGIMRTRLADYDGARGAMNEALAILDRSGDAPETRALALMGLATADRDQGQLDKALAKSLAALSLLESSTEPWRLATCLNQLGMTASRMRDLDSAETYYTKSLSLYRKIGSRWGMTQPVNNLAIIAYYRKRYADAQRLMSQNAALYAELGDSKGQAITLSNQATLAYETGHADVAIPLFERCLPLVQQLGERWLLSNTHASHGYALAQLMQLTDARHSFQQALSVAQEIDSIALILFAMNGLAQVLRLEGGDEKLRGSAEIIAAILNHPSINKINHSKAEVEKAALLESGLTDDLFAADTKLPSIDMLALQQLAL